MEERLLYLRVCEMAIADTTFDGSAFRQWVRWLLISTCLWVEHLRGYVIAFVLSKHFVLPYSLDTASTICNQYSRNTALLP